MEELALHFEPVPERDILTGYVLIENQLDGSTGNERAHADNRDLGRHQDDALKSRSELDVRGVRITRKRDLRTIDVEIRIGIIPEFGGARERCGVGDDLGGRPDRPLSAQGRKSRTRRHSSGD